MTVKCSVALPGGAVGWSAVCNCGNYCSQAPPFSISSHHYVYILMAICLYFVKTHVEQF